MKKLLFSVAALAAFGIAQAQEETGGTGFAKNDVFVSGSLGYSSQKTGDIKTTSFNVIPRVGYFVSDNFAIGAQLGYASTERTYYTEFDIAEAKTTGFELGAFARYYGSPAKSFSFFGQLSASYLTAKTEYEGGGESKVNGFGLGVAPGISYFVSDNIALEATFGALNYSTTKPDEDNAESTDNFDLNLNLTEVTFGIIYKF